MTRVSPIGLLALLLAVVPACSNEQSAAGGLTDPSIDADTLPDIHGNLAFDGGDDPESELDPVDVQEPAVDRGETADAQDGIVDPRDDAGASDAIDLAADAAVSSDALDASAVDGGDSADATTDTPTDAVDLAPWDGADEPAGDASGDALDVEADDTGAADWGDAADQDLTAPDAPDASDLDDADASDAAVDLGADLLDLGGEDVLSDGDADGAPSGPRFVDISASLPIASFDDLDVVFGAVALVDVDLDENLDILYSGQDGELRLLLNQGDWVFVEAADSFSGSTIDQVRTLGYADLENDGDPDIYVGARGRAHLLINQGDGSFVDEALTWGLGRLSRRSAVSFADFDNDGLVDLYESSYEGRRNRLRRNQGDRFVTITETPGNSPDMGTTLGVAWTDVNQDGLVDLHVVNDFGMVYGPNHFYLNAGPDPLDENNWLFTDVGLETGFEVAILGMGTAFGDFDNDGDLDNYTCDLGRNVMHVVEAADSGHCPADLSTNFCVVDRARELGVGLAQIAQPGPPAVWPTYDPDSDDPLTAGLAVFCEEYCDTEADTYAVTSWSPIFFDADHNGWLDLFVGNGWVQFSRMPMARDVPNVLFLNSDGAFTEAGPEVLPTGLVTTRGAAVGDLDRDGDLDLVWLDNGSLGVGRLHVLENRLSDGNWLQVVLTASQSNADAIGARLTLEAGDLTLTREVDGGQGFASASERHPHFGLGDRELVDRLTIRWPSGVVQELTDVAVNQRLVVEEPTGE